MTHPSFCCTPASATAACGTRSCPCCTGRARRRDPDLRGFGRARRPRAVLPPPRRHRAARRRSAPSARTSSAPRSAAGRAPGRGAGARAGLSLALLAPALPEWDFTDPGLLEYGEAEEAAFERGDVEAAVELNVDFWASALDRRPRVRGRRPAPGVRAGQGEEEEQPFDLAAVRAPRSSWSARDVPDFVAIGEHIARRSRAPSCRSSRTPGTCSRSSGPP